MKEQQKMSIHCPHCVGTGVVRTGEQTAICPKCGMKISLGRDDGTWLQAEVQGDSSQEVADVVKELMNGSIKKHSNFNISDSNIGILNTGQINDIESINLSINNIAKSGNEEFSEALSKVLQAVIDEKHFSENDRSDLLTQLNHIGNEAKKPENKRTPHAIMKPIINGIGTSLSAAGGAASVWAVWGPVIRSFFGL